MFACAEKLSVLELMTLADGEAEDERTRGPEDASEATHPALHLEEAGLLFDPVPEARQATVYHWSPTNSDALSMAIDSPHVSSPLEEDQRSEGDLNVPNAESSSTLVSIYRRSPSIESPEIFAGDDHERHNTIQDSEALTRASSVGSSSIATSRAATYLNDLPTLEQDASGALVVNPNRRPSVLECPFNLLFCFEKFASLNQRDWMLHSLTHFKPVEPPKLNRCCFCDEVFESFDGCTSWKNRMDHVFLHHSLGHQLRVARPDFQLYRYLREHNIISDAVYQDIEGDPHQSNTLMMGDLLGKYTTLYQF